MTHIPLARLPLLCLFALTLGPITLAHAQDTKSPAPEPRASPADPILADPLTTIYLTNVTSQNEAFDLQTLLRNMLNARDRIYFLAAKNAIVLRAAPDEIATAKRLIAELDRPKKLYKLTYTLAEMDGTNRIGIQHFDVVVLSGQKVTLKQGNRVPVVTGSTTNAQNPTQVTYLDVGINIDAEIIQGGDRVTLKTRVERSGVADTTTGLSSQDPVIRQTLVEGEVNLEDGKPLIIGSVNVVGTTRHIDVDVVARTMP